MADFENEFPCVTEPSKARFIISNRGNQLLVDVFNYVYMCNVKKENGTYWKCVQYEKTKCKGNAYTDLGNEVQWTKRHNHALDPVKVKVREETQNVIDMAKANPSLGTAHLVAKWSKATVAPVNKAITRRIQRTKQATKNLDSELVSILDKIESGEADNDLIGFCNSMLA
jgi:hypothetical protein